MNFSRLLYSVRKFSHSAVKTIGNIDPETFGGWEVKFSILVQPYEITIETIFNTPVVLPDPAHGIFQTFLG